MSIVNYNEIADSPRILKVQLENLTVVCIMCTKLGKLESFYNHSCSPTQEPRKYQHVTIVENNPSLQKKTMRSFKLQTFSETRH